MASTRNKPWAERIVGLMDEAGVTVDDLIKSLRVKRATVYSWRLGTRIPRREIQPRLARRLGTTVAELNGWAA